MIPKGTRLLLFLSMKTSFFSIALLLFTACGVWAQGAPLRNGDTIEIRLSGVPVDDLSTFNAPYTIDDHGMINVPFIKEIKVAGLLPNQIQEIIQNRLKEEKIFTNPTVTILQNQVRFVNVMGEVKAPQRVPFTADMTLVSALSGCGGFTDFADQKHVRLTREGKTTVYNIKTIRADPTLDPKLLPGDQIQVPSSWY